MIGYKPSLKNSTKCFLSKVAHCKIAKWHFAGTGAPLDQIDANACPPPEQQQHAVPTQWLAKVKWIKLVQVYGLQLKWLNRFAKSYYSTVDILTLATSILMQQTFPSEWAPFCFGALCYLPDQFGTIKPFSRFNNKQQDNPLFCTGSLYASTLMTGFGTSDQIALACRICVIFCWPRPISNQAFMTRKWYDCQADHVIRRRPARIKRRHDML